MRPHYIWTSSADVGTPPFECGCLTGALFVKNDDSGQCRLCQFVPAFDCLCFCPDASLTMKSLLPEEGTLFCSVSSIPMKPRILTDFRGPVSFIEVKETFCRLYCFFIFPLEGGTLQYLSTPLEAVAQL